MLKLTVLGGAAVLLPIAPSLSTFLGKQAPASPNVAQFEVPLAIPATIEPVRSEATTDVFELTQRLARVEILPGLTTTIWGYIGIFPGPTFRVRSGRQVVVRQTNLLPDPVVVHQHGGLTPADSDGYPTDVILPGATRNYTYPNNRPASTMWYHDHAMDTTGYHTYMGLAGFYIYGDDLDDRLPLPKGECDVPPLLADRTFASDGSLVFDPLGTIGVVGADVMLVNGRPWPRFEVANRAYRFRFLNASNTSSFDLALSSGQPLVQIAADGGLLPAPVSLPVLPLAMAERADVVIDFSAYPLGSQVVLENRQLTGRMGQVMRFDVTRSETDDSAVPSTLRALDPLPEASAVRTRDWVFGPRADSNAMPPVEWVINGNEFDPDRIDARPSLGDVEIWRITNQAVFGLAGMDHPVHIHLVTFRILDVDGQPPPPHLGGWKDTVLIPKGHQARLIMRFTDFRGKYIMHCHNLEHEDTAMMTNFEVV